ncbi:hypothetical protein TIFTF001_026787 [Ficus carica]|uniref:Ubiquitin-like protease family profile domain-containing protein n=1 Tax=Ficus carica TaxID=3494 RepID=A0AA88IYM5_FICCA|nr:hypothetical protein TIFTF001_026787 [Ficus carica]
MSQDHEEECSTQTHVGKPRQTNSPRFNPDEDGRRIATLMTRVHQVRAKRQRIEVSFDGKGQPLGKADLAQRKEIVWMEVVTSFTVDESYKRCVLNSCGESAKGFRYDLYQAFVRDHIDDENVWQRPPKVVNNYPTITQDDWEKFIQYRRTPEFKRLSEQGSEIRKKSKYGSTGGRDGYRKRDQAHKTGKYAERYESWLDMRVKPDGGLKKEEFKPITENIDILTKALGNAEHSGRIRGQSKFVKQSQYFNLVHPSREKDEVSDMKLKIAALERTVQELCAKHGINRETMAEEMTAPTVDQHNSFRASCTLNEKEAGPSDPNPMLNASKECHLFIPDLVNKGVVLVAINRAYVDCVPADIVHGIPLCEENVRVTITVPKLNRALLPIPTNEATSIEEAVGGFVAWPKSLVVVQTSLSQASKGPSRAPEREAEGSKRTKKRARRKKIQSQPEVEQQPAQEEMPSFDLNDISFELRPLAFYAQSSMRDSTQIVCPQQHFVMGDEMPIYIGFEDVYHFISFKEISANSIMIYIRYLVECCARTGIDQRFEFISPVLVSPVQQNVDRATYVRERAECILRILRNAPKGKRFLMPYNSGQHWILAVIDPWDDSIMYFNPLGNEPGDDFKDLITTALNDWKLLVGSGIRQRRNWQTLIDTVRCPIQEGYVECGYFVLAYMREITFTVDGLAVLQTKDFYTDADMSLVRNEWANFVMRFIHY